MHKPLVIVPTYNEHANLEALINDIRGVTPETAILVVDDNSPDKTGELADRLAQTTPDVHVLHRPGKQGLGRAYLAGFAWALERAYDPICTMDADRSHPAEALPVLIEATKDADIAIGSRYIKGGKIHGWPWQRYALSWTANVLTRLSLGLRPNDVTAGYKCYRRSFLESLDLNAIVSPGYAFQVEMITKAHDLNLALRELPITFHDRTIGQSKVSRHELVSSAKSLLVLTIARPALRQFGRFVIVGLINVVTDLLVTNLLVLGLHWQPAPAGYAGILVSLIQSFFLNRRWTFRPTNKTVLEELTHFFLVNGAGAVINTITYTLILDQFHIWYNWAKLFALLGSGLWNFFGTKYWVFRPKTAR